MSRVYEEPPYQRPAFGPVGGQGYVGGGGNRRLRLPGQSWQQLIQGDPRYQQFMGAQRMQSQQAAAARQAGVRAALVKFGMTPDLKAALAKLGLGQSSVIGAPYANLVGQDVNQETLDQAGNNDLSFSKLEDKGHQQNLTDLQDTLAGSGLLDSGQTGFNTGLENTRHTSAVNDAVQNLIGYLTGQYTDFAQGEAGRAQGLADFGGTLEQNLLDEGVNPAPSPGEAVFDPSVGAFSLNGRWYDESGQDITGQVHVPPPAAPGAPPGAPPGYRPVPRNQPGFRRAARRLRRR